MLVSGPGFAYRRDGRHGAAGERPMGNTTEARRPLTSRSTPWARAIAAALAKGSITPNQISVASVLVAGVGAYLLIAHPRAPWAFVACAACVQLRLLANMIDGLVAVEGGKGTPTGALYNEIPDRIADSLFLVALGYAALTSFVLATLTGTDHERRVLEDASRWIALHGIELGWYAALAAAVTAYIRVLGGALGLAQDFRGPQAKPHRMFVMTVGLAAAAVEVAANGTTHALALTLASIAVGTTLTCIARARAIAAQLRARA